MGRLAGDPTVSVILPTYNRAAWLREAVVSALAQTHAPLEILVVDDGSTDETEAVCRSFPEPVRYIRQRNAGVAAARNRGAREAKGEYLAYLDSDDVWKPEKLAVQLAAHRAAPEAGWSMTDFDIVLPSGEPRERRQGFRGAFPVFDDLDVEPAAFFARALERATFHAAGASYTLFGGDAFELFFHGNFVQPTGFVVRREVMAATPGFDEALRVASDTEFFHRLAAASPGAIVMSRLYGWRIGHDECLTTKSNVPRLIETGLLSLERAARLRAPLSPPAERALRETQRRLRMKLAYARLTELDGPAARGEIRRALALGQAPTLRGVGIFVASMLPKPALRALHGLKRAALARP